ncbi:MAG: DUF5683 domain-containing protein [Candidatus Krumholzibacteriia bacterium]
MTRSAALPTRRSVTGLMLLGIGLFCGPVLAQTATPDSLGQAADLPPEINPVAADLSPEPVDIWDTGVSPTGAVLMSPLFPGWGQLYTGNSWRAALAFGAEMYFWTNLIVRDQRARRGRRFATNFLEDSANYQYYNAVAEEDWNQMRDFAWWSGGALLIIALDAYVGAHLFNFDEDPVPMPDQWDDTFGIPGADMPGGAPAPQLTVFRWRKTF